MLELSYSLSQDIIKEYLESVSRNKIEVFRQLPQQEGTAVLGRLSNSEYKNLLREVLKVKDGKDLENIMNKRKSGLRPISVAQEQLILNTILKNTGLQKRLAKSISIRTYSQLYSKVIQGVSWTKYASSFWSFLGKAVLLVGVTDAMADIASGQANYIDILLFATPQAPLNIWASLSVEDYSKRFEEMYFRDFLRWKDILNWRQNKYSRNILFLQYVDKDNRYSTVAPTSIIFRDINFAEMVFGFRPKYVNCDFLKKDGSYFPGFYTAIP